MRVNINIFDLCVFFVFSFKIFIRKQMYYIILQKNKLYMQSNIESIWNVSFLKI